MKRRSGGLPPRRLASSSQELSACAAEATRALGWYSFFSLAPPSLLSPRRPRLATVFGRCPVDPWRAPAHPPGLLSGRRGPAAATLRGPLTLTPPAPGSSQAAARPHCRRRRPAPRPLFRRELLVPASLPALFIQIHAFPLPILPPFRRAPLSPCLGPLVHRFHRPRRPADSHRRPPRLACFD